TSLRIAGVTGKIACARLRTSRLFWRSPSRKIRWKRSRDWRSRVPAALRSPSSLSPRAKRCRWADPHIRWAAGIKRFLVGARTLLVWSRSITSCAVSCTRVRSHATRGVAQSIQAAREDPRDLNQRPDSSPKAVVRFRLESYRIYEQTDPLPIDV